MLYLRALNSSSVSWGMIWNDRAGVGVGVVMRRSLQDGVCAAYPLGA